MRDVLRKLALALTIAGILGVSLVATAEANDGAIAHRKAVMAAIGGHMKAMAAIVKGQVPFKDDLKGHAHAMSELAKITGKVFPEGSGSGDTRAAAAIWEKPDEFKEVVVQFQTASADLAKAAESGDMSAFGAKFGGVGKSCKACHSDFRSK